MDKSPGARIGRYEIVSLLGSGGMGEVYRARDARLKRDVAIKFLPDALLQDSEKRKRFEHEAQAASALNHPNILVVHDIGSENDSHFIVSELIDGNPLRNYIQKGGIPTKKLIDIAIHISAGLAAAHQAGIIHRDLKPENIMITADGLVKILDFGLAKLVQPETGPPNVDTLSLSLTKSGVLYGTVPYMSPEQARGSNVDYRSDQFSFGLILYELATGKRAFERPTVPQILSAIIDEDPQPLSTSNPSMPAPLQWIIERCLSKDPRERYDSTGDLHRELSTLRDHLTHPESNKFIHTTQKSFPKISILFGLIFAALILGLFLMFQKGKKEAVQVTQDSNAQPVYKRLTFRRGTVYAARFLPDGQVVYSAAWDGNPPELFVGVPGSAEHRSLGLLNAQILSVSSKGELAVLVRCHYASPDISLVGTLARLPLLGGAPRELAENVLSADWNADGQNLAVIRELGGRFRLEFPIGKLLYETPDQIRDVRISPNGDSLAFLETSETYTVAMVNLSGKKTILSQGLDYTWGLGWSPKGDEIYYSAAKSMLFPKEIHAVTLTGKDRLLFRQTNDIRFQDIRNGQILAVVNNERAQMNAFHDGDAKERDLSWFDWTWSRDISPDGKTILFLELGEGTGSNKDVTYIRNISDPSATRLGEASPYALSPDGKWVLATPSQNTRFRDKQLILIPTGAGESLAIKAGPIESYGNANWFPDGQRILFEGKEKNRGSRIYTQAIQDSAPHPITDEGFHLLERAISQDGKYIILEAKDHKLWLFKTDGSAPSLIPFNKPVRAIAGWKADGSGAFLVLDFERPAKVYLLNPWTGKTTLWKVLDPPDPTGVTCIFGPRFTPDGKSYVYTYERMLSDLYTLDLR